MLAAKKEEVWSWRDDVENDGVNVLHGGWHFLLLFRWKTRLCSRNFLADGAVLMDGRVLIISMKSVKERGDH